MEDAKETKAMNNGDETESIDPIQRAQTCHVSEDELVESYLKRMDQYLTLKTDLAEKLAKVRRA
jgi:hypothetical protein